MKKPDPIRVRQALKIIAERERVKSNDKETEGRTGQVKKAG